MKATIAVCGLCGIAGWVLWARILGRELGQDWMVFYTAVRAYFDGDTGLVKRSTSRWFYALMGLLRQRPEVNPDHTEFEAFARYDLEVLGRG